MYYKMGVGSSSVDLNETNEGCLIANIVKNVKGLSSNSASPSDTWILELKDNVYYNKQRITGIFLKYFIDPYSFEKEDINTEEKNVLVQNIYALRYEVSIYRDVIRPLIDYNICPNFVKYYGSGYSCSRTALVNILKETGATPIRSEMAVVNATRYMGNAWSGRPSIDVIGEGDHYQSNDFPVFFPENVLPKVKYTFLMNEVMPSEALTLQDAFDKYFVDDTNILFILYEIFYSCYCMTLTKTNHNDLHFNNIYLIPRNKRKNIKYQVEDLEPIVIPSDYEIKIFDFDRGYSERIGINIGNLNKVRMNFGNNNSFVPVKDFYKLIITLSRIKQDYIELLSGNDQYLRGKVIIYSRDPYSNFYMYNNQYIGDDFLNSLQQPIQIIDMVQKALKPNQLDIRMFDLSYSVNSNMFDDSGKLKLDKMETDLSEEIIRLKQELYKCNNSLKNILY